LYGGWFDCEIAVMEDRGFFLTWQAIRRQFAGKWAASQVVNQTLDGRPVGGRRYHPFSAGYILVDLDRADPTAMDLMRANGHDPCVVLQTSPGHLQAWIHLSSSPLEPTMATAAGQHLAHLYGGDRASADIVTWAALRDSPIKSPHDAHSTAMPRG
jgi:hypothetical protein